MRCWFWRSSLTEMVSLKSSCCVILLLLPVVICIFINTTEVLILFARYCGQHRLCRPEVVGFPIATMYVMEYFDQCPHCHCDEDCFVYNDCCIDMVIDTFLFNSTSNEINETFLATRRFTPNISSINDDYPVKNTTTRDTGVTYAYSDDASKNKQLTEVVTEHRREFTGSFECFSSYFLVSKCDMDYHHALKNKENETQATATLNKCENVNTPTNDYVTKIPVYSPVSRMSYRNMYCAICNNDTESIESWDAIVVCPYIHNFGVYAFETYFNDINKTCGSEISFKPKERQHSRACNPLKSIQPDIDACSSSRRNEQNQQFVEVACQTFDIPFRYKKNVFKNVFCYHCNPGVFVSDVDKNTKDITVNTTCPIAQNSPTSKFSIPTRTRKPDVLTKQPSSATLTAYKRTSANNSTDENKMTAWACENFIQFGWGITTLSEYKNIFCCLCNRMSLWQCKKISFENTDTHKIEPQTYTFLFDFTTKVNEKDPEKNTGDGICDNDQFFDVYQERCRDIVCSPGRMYMHELDRCISEVNVSANIGYTLDTVYIICGNETDAILELESFIDEMKATFLKKASALFNTSVTVNTLYINGYHTICTSSYSRQLLRHITSKLDISGSDNIGQATAFIQWKMDFVLLNVYKDEIEEKVMSLQNMTIALFHVGRNIKLVPTMSELSVVTAEMMTNGLEEDLNINYSGPEHCLSYFKIYKRPSSIIEQQIYKYMEYVNIHQLLICSQVKIEQNEFVAVGSRINVIANKQMYTPNKYQVLDDGSVRVCLKNYIHATKTLHSGMHDVFNFMHGLRIISYSLNIISLSSLCFTFITYCIHSELRTTPGKNNMCLVLVMFFMNICLALNWIGDLGIYRCVLLGMLTHYFCLCTFFSMNICSFHMFRVFSSHILSRSYIRDRRVIWYYTCFIFGSPLFVLTSTVVTNLITSEGKSLGYGYPFCFLRGNRNVGVFVVLPVLCILALNCFYFVVTSCKIWKAPRIESSIKDNRRFSIYLKLFSITGISWILQIVDSQLSNQFLHLTSVVLNASQGLFIFLAFICNRRVFNMYAVMIRKSKIRRLQTTSVDANVANLTISEKQNSERKPQTTL